MVFDHISQLKDKWTDKWVVVDRTRPELKRFENATGRVKTVNMNGRALVQFDQWANIGWVDIDPIYLTVVDQPVAAVSAEASEPVKAKAKPAAESKPKSPASAKGAPAAKGGGMSVEDILAAARAGKSPTQTATPTSKESKADAGPKVEKSPLAESKKPTAVGMSVNDIIAAARQNVSKAAPQAAPASPDRATNEEPPEPVAAGEAPPPDVVAPSAAGHSMAGKITDIAAIIAYCREHDRR